MNFLPPRAWWRAFRPTPIGIDAREWIRLVVGAMIGIGLSALLGHELGRAGGLSLPWLMAPLGASAVLVFAVPASPMAQPWNVVVGNALSALFGIAIARGLHGFGPVELHAALAVSGAIGLMLLLRCLHPPGGATALMMVLGGVADPAFALFPVMLNSALLVACGIAYNNATGRSYPHLPLSPVPSKLNPERAAFDADLDAVLARYNQVLDVSRDDLKALLAETRLRAYDRKLSEVHRDDIMSRDVVTVQFGTPLEEAWALLRTRGIKALPVVDRANRIAGIVTVADFMRAAEPDVHQGFGERLRKLILSSPATHSDKPEVVGQIMTRNVRVTGMQRHLVDLLPLFGSTGHHHIPVIGDGERLVGIITQSDLVSALGRAVDPGV
jgi:CBS domain-containing membrane protein